MASRPGPRAGKSRAIMLHGTCAVSLFLVVATAASAPRAGAPTRSRGAGLPTVFVWAWERADDLRFVSGRGVGVAPLVATLTLAGDHVLPAGRRQPLALPAAVPVLPVVRVELAARPAPTLSPRQRAELVARLAALATSLPGSRGLQLDFDAPRSARAFDRALLVDLRRALPDSLWLSMTALASWCDGDRWLASLPVDEIVPMLFRMGPAGENERARMAARRALGARECGEALGLSTDEPAVRGPGVRRVYWFHPGPWTPTALARALAAGAP
jgi:hypothetical protein